MKKIFLILILLYFLKFERTRKFKILFKKALENNLQLNAERKN